ncbi:IS66 family insertion sequence element accessory protein TnpA [Ningiella sp. W23]|uniref:IS66 family insertion sequence element accessory protein TnpA n=1 Tax=Ningiella sp. W23 TaxID=3023715 RepID=UPI00375677A8
MFAGQSDSGLSVRAYCECHGINRQTFDSRKSDFYRTLRSPSRALAKLKTPKSAAVSCHFNGVELAYSDAVNPQWFADMVKALAQWRCSLSLTISIYTPLRLILESRLKTC